MSTKIIEVILQSRRDNDYNYQAVESTFIPLKGEICFVDTAQDGLRSKVGDGTTLWANLPYTDESIDVEIIIRGYYSNNQFYSDANLTTLITGAIDKIYIDIPQSAVYTYNGTQYIPVTQNITLATETEAGVMKLYGTLGQNIDGTINQKVLTDKLNEKIEVKTDIDNELLTFFID